MTTTATAVLTVSAFAVVPGAERDLVVAATASGLRTSDDGGRSWRRLSAAEPGFVEAVAISPNFAEGRTLLAGASEGLLRSTNGGASWETTLVGSPIVALAAGLDRDGRIVALAGTETDGIFCSTDGGAHWASANPGLLDLETLALALSPAFALDKTAFAGTVGGLYRTRNGGKAWRPLDRPRAEVAVQCLAMSPAFATDGIVLAGTEADGLLRSADGGRTWAIAADLGERGVTALAWSRHTPGLVAAALAEGVAVSANGGGSWKLGGGGSGAAALCLAFVSGSEGEALLAGLPAAGIVRSGDAGRTWEDANAGLTSEETL